MHGLPYVCICGTTLFLHPFVCLSEVLRISAWYKAYFYLPFGAVQELSARPFLVLRACVDCEAKPLQACYAAAAEHLCLV